MEKALTCSINVCYSELNAVKQKIVVAGGNQPLNTSQNWVDRVDQGDLNLRQARGSLRNTSFLCFG
jgi:hypothetical protein